MICTVASLLAREGLDFTAHQEFKECFGSVCVKVRTIDEDKTCVAVYFMH